MAINSLLIRKGTYQLVLKILLEKCWFSFIFCKSKTLFALGPGQWDVNFNDFYANGAGI